MKVMDISYSGADGDNRTIVVNTGNRVNTYDSNIKIGVIVSTWASKAYVHLGLESWKRNYPSVKMLIHDDASHESNDLKKIAHQYGADFETNAVKRGHTVGDLSAFYGGLVWAEEQGLDVLVKFSRRFIPTYEWTPDFLNLATETQALTFSNVCQNLNWGFRTECVAMNVSAWHTRLGEIAEELNKTDTFCEGFIHNIGRDLAQKSACPHYTQYAARHPLPKWCDGHIHWAMMGTNRVKKVKGILWHHSCTPAEYALVAKNYSLPYTITDFMIPESHLSKDTRIS
jgi:hypothetical protein